MKEHGLDIRDDQRPEITSVFNGILEHPEGIMTIENYFPGAISASSICPTLAGGTWREACYPVHVLHWIFFLIVHTFAELENWVLNAVVSPHLSFVLYQLKRFL